MLTVPTVAGAELLAAGELRGVGNAATGARSCDGAAVATGDIESVLAGVARVDAIRRM
jgi:hypothetical protein